MRTGGVFGVVALGLLTAACGNNTTQRAATGGLTGAAVGAIVAGPVGALAGAGAGAAGGWAMPEGADTLALNAIGQEHKVASSALNDVGLGSSAQSTELVKEAQTELQREGFYNGPIDGIVGPETKQALGAYQQREGLQQTASLDQQTLRHMNLAGASAQARQGTRGGTAAASGTSMPPAMSADDIRDKLESAGYTNVANLQRQPNGTYTAKADRGNDSYRLRVDARSGRVISQRRLAANQAAPGAGTSTSTSTSGNNQ